MENPKNWYWHLRFNECNLYITESSFIETRYPGHIRTNLIRIRSWKRKEHIHLIFPKKRDCLDALKRIEQAIKRSLTHGIEYVIYKRDPWL